MGVRQVGAHFVNSSLQKWKFEQIVSILLANSGKIVYICSPVL